VIGRNSTEETLGILELNSKTKTNSGEEQTVLSTDKKGEWDPGIS